MDHNNSCLDFSFCLYEDICLTVYILIQLIVFSKQIFKIIHIILFIHIYCQVSEIIYFYQLRLSETLFVLILIWPHLMQT